MANEQMQSVFFIDLRADIEDIPGEEYSLSLGEGWGEVFCTKSIHSALFINQRNIYPSRIRAFVMHKIILAGPQGIAKPLDAKGIFDFLQPHYIYPIPLADIRQHAGDILHFSVVPCVTPSPLPFRRPLIIVFLDDPFIR